MNPDLLTVAGTGFLTVLVAMTLLWVISVRTGDVSIVDAFWGPGFALAGATYLVVDGRFAERGILAITLVTVWAARLGFHLLVRNLRSAEEDARYQAMRAPHGDRYWWVSLFTVFWLQSVLLWIISAPLLGAVRSDTPLGLLDLLGATVFLIGLTIETLADRQLKRFKADPTNRGQVLDSGLWRYSRHPNYFGDFVVWWGLYLIALSGGAWWSAFGPALISWLLLRVSGVTMLEKSLKNTKPGYEEYVRRTSAFVPWPPKEQKP